MATDFSKAIQNRIILLSGSDTYARNRAYQQILESAGGEPEETEQYRADSKDPLTWCANVSTAPFFSQRRIAIVKAIRRCNLEKIWDATIDKQHPLVAMLAALPDTSLLLLVDDDESVQDFGNRDNSILKQWTKAVTLAGGTCLQFQIDPAKTVELIRARAKDLGKKISARAASVLSEMVLGNPDLAMAELEKAVLYVGESEEVREDDIRAVAIADHEYNVFWLVDAMISGNANKAMAQFQKLCAQTQKVEEQIFPRVFPTLQTEIRKIWAAKLCLDQGCSAVNPPPEMGKWLPTKRLSSDRDFVQEKVQRAARRLDFWTLEQCLVQIVDADSEIKGQKAGVSPIESFERMTLELCRLCSSR